MRSMTKEKTEEGKNEEYRTKEKTHGGERVGGGGRMRCIYRTKEKTGGGERKGAE